MKYVPNILSIIRIFLGASILTIYPLNDIFSFNLTILIVGIALLTDILDGIIARKFNVVSQEGYILDGLGDRAFYVSLILMFFVKFKYHIFIAWLLIFREIALYAFRLLIINWRSIKKMRKISLIHALGLRLWLGGYFLCDGCKYYNISDISNDILFNTIQYVTIIITIFVTYFGLILYIHSIIKEK